uniref:BLTX527 n=1 Tax=Nephila pilipes TaxID=299642 RepID=A0A076KZU0_NEPPI|nr:BLTX527 [Nephila pilipes]
MCASHWVSQKPTGAEKLTSTLRSQSGSPASLRGAHRRPATLLGVAAEPEHTRWDPKDGELCPDRTKTGETLLEVRSGSDVQIDRLIRV